MENYRRKGTGKGTYGSSLLTQIPYTCTHTNNIHYSVYPNGSTAHG